MSFIQITYSSIDHYQESHNFHTLKEAQEYAWAWIGEAPTIGHGYAISNDGIGKIVARGCHLKELFPKGIQLLVYITIKASG